jgi:hypothetical protein
LARPWIERAVAAVETIDDGAARGFAHYHLARIYGRSGDAKGALASAKQVADAQRKLYALAHAARAAHASNDAALCEQIVAEGRSAVMNKAGAFVSRAMIKLCFDAATPGAAVEYSQTLSNVGVRRLAHSTIAQEYCARGDRAAADEFLRSVALPGDWLDHGRAAMVRGLIEAGDLKAAGDLVNEIESPEFKDGALTTLAEAYMRQSDAEQANQLALSITDATKRRQLTARFESVKLKDRSLDAWRAAFAAAETREEKTPLVPPLVAKLVEAGAFDEAEQTVDAAAEAIERNPQADVASKFGVYGDAAALAMVRSSHWTIAAGMIAKGETEKAVVQIEKASAALDRLPPEAALVRWPLELQQVGALLSLGRIDEAIARAKSMDRPFNRSHAVVAIAVYQIKTGDVAAGLETAALANADDRTSSGKDHVAAALLLQGETEAASRFVNQQIGDQEGDSQSLQSVARDLVKANRQAELLAFFNRIDRPVARTHLAIGAAEAFLLDK